MKMNLKELREVLAHNKPKKNNLSQFSYTCHIFGEPNPSLSPSFQQYGPIFVATDDLSIKVAIST